MDGQSAPAQKIAPKSPEIIEYSPAALQALEGSGFAKVMLQATGLPEGSISAEVLPEERQRVAAILKAQRQAAPSVPGPGEAYPPAGEVIYMGPQGSLKLTPGELNELYARQLMAQQAWGKLRGQLCYMEDNQLQIARAVMDQALGWKEPVDTPPAPPAAIGSNDPDTAREMKVMRTFLNPRFVQITQVGKGGAPALLHLGPKGYRPRVGAKITAVPNPDQDAGGYVLWGDYNWRGERIG